MNYLKDFNKTNNVEFVVKKSEIQERFKPKEWFFLSSDSKNTHIKGYELPNGDMIIKAHSNVNWLYLKDKDNERFREILLKSDYPLFQENETYYYYWRDDINKFKNEELTEQYFIDSLGHILNLDIRFDKISEEYLNKIDSKFNSLSFDEKRKVIVPLQFFLVKIISSKITNIENKWNFVFKEYFYPYFEINSLGEIYVIEDYFVNHDELELKKLIVQIIKNYVKLENVAVDKKLINDLINKFDYSWKKLETR